MKQAHKCHRLRSSDGFQLTAIRIDVRNSRCVGALKDVPFVFLKFIPLGTSGSCCMLLHKHWQSTRVVQAQARNPERFLGQGHAQAPLRRPRLCPTHGPGWPPAPPTRLPGWVCALRPHLSLIRGLSEKRSQSGQTSAPKSLLCIVTSRSYPCNSGGTLACTQCLVGRPLNLPQCGPPRRGSMSPFSVEKRWHKDECRFHPGGCSGVHR